MFIVFQPKDAPLHHLSVYQILRHSDYVFSPYGNVNTLTKRGKEETKPIFESLCLRMPGTILLQFGMWGTDSGGISTAKIIWFC